MYKSDTQKFSWESAKAYRKGKTLYEMDKYEVD